MFVNGVPFLTTLSRKIKLRTVEHIQSRTAASLSNALTKILKLYARGGFVVNLIMMDGEFAKLESSFELVEINTTAARKHVGKIERSIYTIKERDCPTLHYSTQAACDTSYTLCSYVPQRYASEDRYL